MTILRQEQESGVLEQHWIESRLPQDQLREVGILASDVFGDERRAAEWLCRPNAATDDRQPIALLGDDGGFARVRNFLLRIRYGVLA